MTAIYWLLTPLTNNCRARRLAMPRHQRNKWCRKTNSGVLSSINTINNRMQYNSLFRHLPLPNGSDVILHPRGDGTSSDSVADALQRALIGAEDETDDAIAAHQLQVDVFHSVYCQTS